MQIKRTAWILAVTASIGLLTSPAALALRCGTRLISEGDHQSKLLRYCGEPYSVESRTAQRALVANVGNVLFPGIIEELQIEDWTYNFGPRKLMRIVRLENGVVTDIRQIGYGFLQD